MPAPRALDVVNRLVSRLVLGGLFLGATAVGVCPSCDSSEVPAAVDVGTGGTYGAEISLSLLGRGRVTTNPPAIDCPGNCFAHVVLPSGAVDGGDGGITLIAEDTPGAHFVGFSFAEVELGARARGPAQCSPMTRKASTVPLEDQSMVVVVPFGETHGTPPRGHEAECAAFTSVSLAYAVTAKFEEDPPIPGFDAAIDPSDRDVLFVPSYPTAQAKEIGVTNGYLYWRFDVNGMSGVNYGDLSSNRSGEIVAPGSPIRLFHVDQNAVFQTTDGVLRVILAGSTFPGTDLTLGGAPFCDAVASDLGNVYCRAGTAIYAWDLNDRSAGPSLVHMVQPGSDLAVDGQRFYFSESGAGGGPSRVLSVTKDADVDGASPTFTTLASGQISPFGTTAGATYVAWVGIGPGKTYDVQSVPKLPGSVAAIAFSAPSTPLLAADPNGGEYWVGVPNDGSGAWQIYSIAAGTNAVAFFHSGATELGGLAVDATWVYWTQPNGRVYRAFKNNIDP